MAKEKNPIREVAVFATGIGVIAAVAAYFALTRMDTAPNLCGMKRGTAIGVPLAIIAAFHVFSGIALLTTKAKWAVVCSIISAFITAGFYFLFEITTIGFFQARLVSLLAYALPVLLIVRGRQAFSYIDQSALQKNAGPDVPSPGPSNPRPPSV